MRNSGYLKGSHKRIEMEGLRFGSWSVGPPSHQNTSGNWYWECTCDCGSIYKVEGSKLRSGVSTRCKKCNGTANQKYAKYSRNENTDLYMIRCKDYIKIGTTTDIDMRLTALQANNPYPIELVGFWKGYGYMEETWHKALAHLHHRGEWFKVVGL